MGDHESPMASLSSIENDEKAHAQVQDVNSLMQLLVEGGETLPDPHEEEEAHIRDLYRDSEFLDDVNRFEPQDKEGVVQAILTEMAFFRKMGVYAKVDRSGVKQRQGKIISTKWIDTDKGIKGSPNYRGRLVGRKKEGQGRTQRVVCGHTASRCNQVADCKMCHGAGIQ